MWRRPYRSMSGRWLGQPITCGVEPSMMQIVYEVPVVPFGHGRYSLHFSPISRNPTKRALGIPNRKLDLRFTKGSL